MTDIRPEITKRVPANRDAVPRLRWLALEHLVPLAVFAMLGVAVSWPTAREFSAQLVSDGGDARNNLWLLWHVREFFAGDQALFQMPLLYYPEGINLLSRGLGPLVGIFALPFWPWGPEAAYNGTVLVSLTLTGYFMYLFARGLGLDRLSALFGGVMLTLAPIHMAGLYGHLTKVFLGLIPLTLLANHHAFEEGRSPLWAVLTGLFLGLTLLHNAYQFVFVSLTMGLIFVLAMGAGTPERRRFLVRRALVAGVSILIFAGPMLAGMISVSQSVGIDIDKSVESLRNQPDLVEFLLPPTFHWLVGQRVEAFLEARGAAPSIETAVSLSLTGLALAAVAITRRREQAAPWLVVTALSVLFALGPSLQILGRRLFTPYRLPIILPYAWLAELPGLSFMRAPGRFMMLGAVTFSLLAAFGVAALVQRWPQHRLAIPALASVLLLLEWWPHPWPQEALRPVPELYQQIAGDEDLYGVFDLPITPSEEGGYPGYTSFYQMYQMTHDKGIVSGYLARAYDVHPVFPCVLPALRVPAPDVTLDGTPTACYVNTRLELAEAHYRYVVFHKPQPGDPKYTPDSWGVGEAERFIELFFAGEEPLTDDALATVYEVTPLPDGLEWQPTMGLLRNWYSPEEDFRWAASPATLFVTLPEAQRVTLEITPAMVRNGASELTVAVDGVPVATVPVQQGVKAAVPLDLSAGRNVISLSLAAGNFRPSDSGGEDPRLLSFAVHNLNLITEE